jgi:hypothetical protein
LVGLPISFVACTATLALIALAELTVVAMNVLDDDDGGIDHQAQQHDESEQGDAIDGDAEEINPAQCERQG